MGSSFPIRAPRGWVLVPQEDGNVLIRVQDSGRGISTEDQKKLFQPFSRVELSAAPPIAGTGLGLHLSRKLAEHLGGSLECESGLGIGSIFTLRVVSR